MPLPISSSRRPVKVRGLKELRIGDITMPPPNPSIEPTMPATTPITNGKNGFSSKLYLDRSNSF